MRFTHKHLFTLLAWLVCAGSLAAQSTVFVVRHADRGPEEPDALLTERGLRQADQLGALLADAGIKHIYTTELTRTRQTAAPTAKVTGIEPVIVAQQDFDGLIRQIKSTLRDGEATLVVGHRKTVPRIVQALSGREIEPLVFDEFTRLLVVTVMPDGTASVVTLRFGLD